MKIIRFNPTSHEVTYLDANGQQYVTIVPPEHRINQESKVLYSNKFTADIKRKKVIKRASIVLLILILFSILRFSLWAL